MSNDIARGGVEISTSGGGVGGGGGGGNSNSNCNNNNSGGAGGTGGTGETGGTGGTGGFLFDSADLLDAVAAIRSPNRSEFLPVEGNWGLMHVSQRGRKAG